MRNRQYPPLNQGQREVNRNELSHIAGIFVSLYGDPINNKLNRLLLICDEAFAQAGILVTIPQAIASLQTLIGNALLDEDEEKFKSFLPNWIQQYKVLDETPGHQNIISQYAPGIIGSLKDLSRSPYQAEGDEYDIRLALRSLIVHPDAVNQFGAYVLPPIPISAGQYSDEYPPHVFIKNYIATVLDHNSAKLNEHPNEVIRLVTLVNAGQGHWLTAHVTLKQGKVSEATLFDSKDRTNGEMPQSVQEAHQNFQTAINQINKNKSINVQMRFTKNQRDGFRCADYATQQALLLMPAEMVEATGLTSLRDARSGEELREAFIATLQQNHPGLGLDRIKDQGLREGAEQIFSKKDFTRTVKEEVEKALVMASKSKEPDVKELQIQFDAMLAKKLQDLYKNPRGQSEQALFEKAFKETFIHFRERFGFFQPQIESGRDDVGDSLLLSNSNSSKKKK